MKIREFTKYLVKLEETAARNEITVILANLFNQASVKEIDKICYLVLGQLAPLHRSIEFNLAEKMMIRVLAHTFKKPKKKVLRLFKKVGDLGDIAHQLSNKKKAKPLKISELYTELATIAKQGGLGSQERKIKLFSQLIDKLDPLAAKYIVRIPMAKLRLGFSDLTILDALSWMKSGDKTLRPKLERAYSVSADIGLVAKIFKEKGVKGIEKITPQVGIPIRPALAGRLNNSEEIIAKLEKHAIECKYDGLRVQIHIDKNRFFKEQGDSLFKDQKSYVRIFSRRMDDTTNMFPDIASAVQDLAVKSAIFDGEAIGFDPKTGKFLPFQETAQRKRKYDIKKTAKKIPLKAFLFDLLYLNGKSLLKKPFKERRQALEKILKKQKKGRTINLTPQRIVKNQKEIDEYFQECVKQGFEGTLSKKLDSPYQAGARDFTWVKYKRAMKSKLVDTVDCLVLGYYRGKGKRSKFGIGAFLTGIWEPKKRAFLTIAKIGTGLTDNQWKEIRQKADKIKAKEKPKQYQVPKELAPDVWANPEIVVEIKADEVTKSPIHSSKYALRFPRMERFRAKKIEDVTSLNEIIKLYKMQ